MSEQHNPYSEQQRARRLGRDLVSQVDALFNAQPYGVDEYITSDQQEKARKKGQERCYQIALCRLNERLFRIEYDATEHKDGSREERVVIADLNLERLSRIKNYLVVLYELSVNKGFEPQLHEVFRPTLKKKRFSFAESNIDRPASSAEVADYITLLANGELIEYESARLYFEQLEQAEVRELAQQLVPRSVMRFLRR